MAGAQRPRTRQASPTQKGLPTQSWPHWEKDTETVSGLAQPRELEEDQERLPNHNGMCFPWEPENL